MPIVIVAPASARLGLCPAFQFKYKLPHFLHAFLLFWQDPQAALQRAAVTCGDSDSIACLTGAFAGAYHGIGIWPGDWIERIEYEDDLNVVTDILTRFEL